MPKVPPLSGKRVIVILNKHFGFHIISQKGSHVKLRKAGLATLTTIVPNHKELARGTLQGVLDLAQVPLDDFLQYL